MQAQLSYSILTLSLAIWAPIGPIVGIAFAHMLSKNWQRRQWELDNIKDEKRELLREFNALVPVFMDWARSTESFHSSNKTPEQQERWQSYSKNYSDRSTEFHCALKDRLFIAEEVRMLEIEKKWRAAMKHYENSFDESELEKEAIAISQSIAGR